MNDLYHDLFLKATSLTKEKGFEAPDLKITKERYLDNNRASRIASMMGDKLNITSYQQLYCTCIQVHYDLLKHVEKELGIKAYFTIGNLRLGDHYFFKIDDFTMNKLIRGEWGVFNLHAWITLPSLEIIDITFNTTYGLHNDSKENLGGVITKHPSELLGDMFYEPILVGHNHLIKSGLIIP